MSTKSRAKETQCAGSSGAGVRGTKMINQNLKDKLARCESKREHSPIKTP